MQHIKEQVGELPSPLVLVPIIRSLETQLYDTTPFIFLYVPRLIIQFNLHFLFQHNFTCASSVMTLLLNVNIILARLLI